MSARFVSTMQLSNVVQMITLAHQSGILRALRGQGASRELGQIRFVDGEPVAALLGQLTGQAALGVLMNWGECVYAFDEGPQLDGLEGDMGWPGSSARWASPGTTSPLRGGSVGSWPSYGYGSFSSPAPLSPPAGMSTSPSSMVPPLGALPPDSALPTYTGPTTAPASTRGVQTGAHDAARPPAGSPAIATVPDVQAVTQERLKSVPVRTSVSTQVDQLPLDRRERMVLLLVDGQRTVADLIRLIRRSQQEVFAVLYHLRLLGLIELRK